MVVKRSLGEAEDQEGHRREIFNRETRQRNHVPSNYARNVVMHELASQEFVSTLEPLIRRWVRDEVQRACQSFCCSSPRSPFNALEPCGTTSLQLRFMTKMPPMLFTSSKVESEDNGAVKIVLFDTDSNQIVSSGPMSSLKLQIVPLDGDFCVDDDEDWSQKDFEAKIIYARDGKRPLVAGELMVVLKEGVGELGEIYFTDNSSWRRSRKFRLGAQVNSRVRIREARSEAFMVKDHRGESYKKHHPPYLVDDIWRLEKIAKDGAFHKRLGLQRICTVKDFLQMYVTNESSLRKVLGGSCNKTWDAIIKHATDCVLDDKLYLYNCGGEGIGLVFNSIFKILGATFDGQNYLPLQKLVAFQMTVVESLKQRFYKNLDGMLPMADMSVFEVSMLTSNLLGDPHRNSASLPLQNVNIPALLQDQPQMQLTATPYMYAMDNSSQYIAEGSSIQLYNPALRNHPIQKEFSGGPYGEGCSSGSGTISGHLAAEFDFQLGASLWQSNELCSTSCNQPVDNVSSDYSIRFSRNGSPRGRWCKIRAAMKWVSVMRDLAEKRMSNLYPYLDFSS